MTPNAPAKIAWRRLVRRNNRLARVLALALPATAVAAAGAVMYGWTQPGGRVVAVEGRTVAEMAASAVQYDDRDGQGRPFSIAAESVSPVGGDDHHISLRKPLVDMTVSSGAYVALAANESILDRDAGLLSLSGDVTLFHDTGLSFQTDSATVDLAARTAEGNDVVEGQSGDGELISEGFRVRNDGDTIECTGKAYMKIYPKQKNREGQGG
jgi:lipopolysaccharide export system protein LptC